MSIVTVYAKIESPSHTALLEIASRTGRSVMSCTKDAVEMYIDRVNAEDGVKDSPDRIVDGMFNKTMMHKKAVEKLSVIANSPNADMGVVSRLVDDLGVTLEDIEKQNDDRDSKRNNCRYFLKGLLRNGRLEVKHIYDEAHDEGFSANQVRRSLNDVAIAVRVGATEYYWELKQ